MDGLSFAIQMLEALPRLVAAGVDIKALVEQTSAKLAAMRAEKRDPTPQEWEQLNAQIDLLRARLHTAAGG